jgi:hypothetical protein
MFMHFEFKFYCSPNIIRTIKSRMMRMAGHVASIEEGSACRLLAGKRERKRPLRKPGHK